MLCKVQTLAKNHQIVINTRTVWYVGNVIGDRFGPLLDPHYLCAEVRTTLLYSSTVCI
jgi:hypothetical protein